MGLTSDDGRQVWSVAAAAAGHARQLKGLDSVKAQYEVLGNAAKRHVRPVGTIETLGFWSRTPLSDCQH
jgi:hypothetical protein